MNNDQAKELVDEVFNGIKKAKTIEELDEIEKDIRIASNRMDIEKYPQIQFSITREEIQELIDRDFLDAGFITKQATKNLNPLSKLLYAIVWKNGDLKKIKHIVQGITDSNNASDAKEEGLVFYQFGKYLTKMNGEPIVDQHVIRAFKAYNSIEPIEAVRKLSTLNKKHKKDIVEYKAWLNSNAITSELKAKEEYSYHIDKLLFATGKSIKWKMKGK